MILTSLPIGPMLTIVLTGAGTGRMKAKGRARPGGVSGERQWNAHLTTGQVQDIRRRRANGELLKEIAPDYGISLAHVSRLAHNESWRHV